MKLDDDQRQLRDAVRELSGRHAGRAREALSAPGGDEGPAWSDIGQIGLAGIAVAERYGGAGGTLVELGLALEELGRALVPSPLFQTAALAAPLLGGCGDEEAAARWLPPIAAGELRATVAYADVEITADADGRLTGTAPRVIGAATADLLLVACAAGDLFAVQAGAEGLALRPHEVLDPSRPLAGVHLDRVAAVPVGGGAEALARAVLTARGLLAAEQVGGAQWCLEMAVEQAGGRVQFGRPIGTFQAIKHLCADIYTEVECARALTYDALAGSGPDAGPDPVAVAMAGAYAAETFVAAAERNIQVHGGIGYTWEHDCHLYLRRARASERLITVPRSDYAVIAQSLDL